MLKVISVFVSAIFATNASSTEPDIRIRLGSLKEASSVSSAFILPIYSLSSWAPSNTSSMSLQASYVPFATDLSLMLALGAGFVLFGALLRHRRGSRANKFGVAHGTETTQDAENWKTTESGKLHLSQTPKSTDLKSDSTCLPTLIAAQEALPRAAESNEVR
jgi:hypothetical protein